LLKIHTTNGLKNECYDILLKYLKSFQGAPAKDLANIKQAAVQVVQSCINSSDLSSCDELLSLSAVTALKGDAQYGPLFELLTILTSDSVETYVKFAEANKSYLEKLGVDESAALAKLRVLTLCSLGAQKGGVWSFSDLAKALHVSVGAELEEAVVEAVCSGKVDAKIDQEQQCVIVERVTPRVFAGKVAWTELGEKLTMWTKNIQHVMRSFRDARDQFEAQHQHQVSQQQGPPGGKDA